MMGGALLHGIEEVPKLITRQLACRTDGEVAQTQWTERRTSQFKDRVSDVVEDPPDDAVATDVDVELDQRTAARPVDDPEAVDRCRPVVELDVGAQAGR